MAKYIVNEKHVSIRLACEFLDKSSSSNSPPPQREIPSTSPLKLESYINMVRIIWEEQLKP